MEICACLSSVNNVNSEAAMAAMYVICHKDIYQLHNATTFIISVFRIIQNNLMLCDAPATRQGHDQCVHHLRHCHGEDWQTLWGHLLLPLQGVLQTGAGITV